ncbi:MAG: phospholipase D family protein [Planctomycetota bacterium]|nr:phospholipase D family protein [Planctomycetota bacterium]
MQELVSLGVWDKIKTLAKRGRPRLAAVAYASSDAYVKFGRGDVLIVDASDRAISTALTSAKVLAAAARRGAQIFHMPGLHAKVFVLGNTAVIGSANMSVSSANDLIEAAFVTDSRSAVAAAKSLILQLADQANVVDERFLKRIKAIKVERTGGRGGGKRKSGIKVDTSGSSTWIVGLGELKEDEHEDEAARADEGERHAKELQKWGNSHIYWIRCGGTDSFSRQAKPGDFIIQILKPLRGATRVLRHCAVLRRQNEPGNVTRFYIEEPAGIERRSMSLMAFRALLHQHGWKGKVGPTMSRRIGLRLADALHDNWGSAK